MTRQENTEDKIQKQDKTTENNNLSVWSKIKTIVSERNDIRPSICMLVFVIMIFVTACFNYYGRARASRALEGSFAINVETTRLADFYPEEKVYWQNGDIIVSDYVSNDGEFLAHCLHSYPEACLEEAPWKTAEDVLELFETDAHQWAFIEDAALGDIYIIWGKEGDYGWHCYGVRPDFPSSYDKYGCDLLSGWLYRDGVRLMAYDEATYSIRPSEVIDLYQSDGWPTPSGWTTNVTLRSEDFGTTVKIDRKGRLLYRYSEKFYSQIADPQGIAYTDYAEPWWEQATDDEKSHIIPSEDSDQSSDNTDEVIQTDYYPDLPIDGQFEVIYASERYQEYDAISDQRSYGTYFLTKNGAVKASGGEIVDQWEFDTEVSDERFCYISYEITPLTYVAYVYNGEQIIGLKPNGKFDVIIEEVIEPPYRGEMDTVIGIVDDNLIAWSSRNWALIAEDVTGALCDGPKLFTKEDGCYAVVGEMLGDINYGEFEIVYLGTESLEYYTQLYDTLHRSYLYN